jgi:2-polyprenyl-3-methyl-5-hydroxy-6-metoxy-1,4-benzoquinol methylase
MNNTHQLPADFGQEFHDLQDIVLNYNCQKLELDGSWGNLGYWVDKNGERINQYSEAAARLADSLAHFTQLKQAHNVLDVGFGCGDQIIHWQHKFGVKNIWGINYSQIQTQYAQQKLSAFGSTAQLIQGDATQANAWQILPDQFDRIIALDCVYHFANKSNFFKLCADHFYHQKELGSDVDQEMVLTDLVLTNPIRNPLQFLILKMVCYFSHIPLGNIKVRKDYEAQLKQADLYLYEYKDISAQVMLPFSKWVFEFRQDVKKLDGKHSAIKNIGWSKYIGTALFLRWAVRHDIFQYVMMRIRAD